jgi:hypothetical protein
MTEAELRQMIEEAVGRGLEHRIDDIAKKVEQRFYSRVGQHAVLQLFKLIGIVAVGAALWFAGKGYISQ